MSSLCAALSGAAGCVTEVVGEPPAPVDEIALVADNGIFLDNGLALTNGSDVGNGIKLTNGFDLSNGIDLANGIKLTNGVDTIEPPPGSDLEKWIDADPTMRLRVIRYQVECALPAGTAIDVIYRATSYTFVGQIALGPGWLQGAMTSVEQERVSACLLARVNGRGERLEILLVGPYPGLDSRSFEESTAYPVREATYYGNLFLDGPAAFVDGLSDCGSRACQLDTDSRGCDCGLLIPDPPGGCEWWLNPEDAGSNLFDTSCSATIGGVSTYFYNPVTTYVRQQPAGGACTIDQDCIYYNCVSGTCGGVGGACNSSGNCAWGIDCGHDGLCGGPGAVCQGGGDAECVHGNCYAQTHCGKQGAACSTNEQCWGNVCRNGRCGSCTGDADCPEGTFCFTRDDVCYRR